MKIISIFALIYIIGSNVAEQEFDSDERDLDSEEDKAEVQAVQPSSVQFQAGQPISSAVYPISPAEGFSDFNGQDYFGASPCGATPCGQVSGQCPGYCNQYPQMCGSSCGVVQQPISTPPIETPPQTITVQVPVRVPKTINEKVSRTVQKQAKLNRTPLKTNKMQVCPQNHQSTRGENGNVECIDNSEFKCPPGYELNAERCVRTLTTCGNEYIRTGDDCVLRIVCPPNYHIRGNECEAPEPRCPHSWHWDVNVCKPDRVTCQSGYELSHDNKCRHEIYTCPSNYREYGTQCIKQESECPYGFYKNRGTNVCEKLVNNCPAGSYEQNGECIRTTYECPPGATDVGDYCTIDQTITRVAYDIKYVNKTITVPGATIPGTTIPGGVTPCNLGNTCGSFRCGSGSPCAG